MNESIIETKLEQSCIRRFFNIIHMIYLYKEIEKSNISVYNQLTIEDFNKIVPNQNRTEGKKYR